MLDPNQFKSFRLLGTGSCSDNHGISRYVGSSTHYAIEGPVAIGLNPLMYVDVNSNKPLICPKLDHYSRIYNEAELNKHLSELSKQECRNHSEPAILLFSTWQDSFYHFIFDVIGKLAIAELYGISSKHTKVHFNIKNQWQRQAFDILEVEVAGLDLYAKHVFDHAFIPSYYCTSGGQPPLELVSYLRRKFHNDLEVPLDRKRFFVGRGNAANGRCALNEQDIYNNVFATDGFKYVVPSNLSLSEQIELFCNSEAIAGIHGGSLSLACIMPAGSHLAEIHSPFYFNRCFQQLALNSSLHYSSFNFKDAFYKPSAWRNDFSVDIDELRKWWLKSTF